MWPTMDELELKRQALADFATYVNPGKARMLRSAGLDILEWRRNGAVVRDADGREFVDCITGMGSFAVGRRHPRVIAALKRAVDEQELDIGDFMLMSKPKADLARTLADVCPEGLDAVMYGTGGGEAVDFAIKLARGVTLRPGVVSTLNGYHGHTGFALSAIGRPQFREPFEPLMPHFTQVAFNDLEAMRAAMDESVGAILVEPIQGEGGINVATDQYLRGLRELCDGQDRVLIFDEIQSGMGRTGKLWASLYSGVAPDIMAVGKSLSGGIYPISATVFRSEYLDFLRAHPFIHLSTFGGADVGCVVALEVFRILEEEGLLENATQRGEQFQAGFTRLLSIYPSMVTDVRGRGLMMALQYTEDQLGPRMTKELAERGVLAMMSGNDPSVMRVMPCLGITAEQVDRVLRGFEDAMAAILEGARLKDAEPSRPPRRPTRRPS